MPSKLFENAAGSFVASFCWLVGIGGGAEGDGFSLFYFAQFGAQQGGGVLLDVDLLFEFGAIAHFHKLVGIAGVTVFASEFAASVRFDGPGKRQAALARAAVQQRFCGEAEIFDLVALAERFALGGETRYADQWGLLE